MAIALVTGSAGLIGSEAVRYFAGKGLDTVGIDNDMRAVFFGPEASTGWNLDRLKASVPGYVHYDVDIRSEDAIDGIFKRHGSHIGVVIHTAAQPSHDWAAGDPMVDFSVNATGTLNLLEHTRRHCPDACFIFTSTNKVYGDRPNTLPLVEHETRWEVAVDHPYFSEGIDESMSIDRSKHSLFGASKVAADMLVQEYGRYFGMKTACFRGGCLTGPGHSGARLHGFLSYLMKCAVTGEPYTIYGYKGKQVRDNIHATDLVEMFWAFFQAPRIGEVYNAGGGRPRSCSVLEAIALCERISGKTVNAAYADSNRSGDHIWWISDCRRFQSHYPQWSIRHDLETILGDIHEGFRGRL